MSDDRTYNLQTLGINEIELMMRIRRATVDDDFEKLSEIYATTWKEAYRNIVPTEFLQELTGRMWADALKARQNDVFIALDGDIYAGTASVCVSHEQMSRDWGEIKSIYVLPEFLSKGYGHALMIEAMNELKKRNAKKAFLWVLEANTRAIGFYRKMGFEPSESKLVTIGGADLRELKYVKHL